MPPLRLLLPLLLAGALLRGVDLGALPPALHHDEAANAADARAFFHAPHLSYPHERGGSVEAVYVALAAAPLQLAPRWLSLEAAARLPAWLAQTALIVAAAAVGLRLGGPAAALTCAACVALQPWGWHFARLALRGTLTPVCALTAWACCERALATPRDQLRWSAAAGAAIALGALTYPPARMILPVWACAWVLSEPRRWSARAAAAAVGPGLVVLLALLPWTLWGDGAKRLDAVWVGGDPLEALRGYVVHFGTRMLFSGSSGRGFAPEGVGLLPLWQAPCLVAGVWGWARRFGGVERRALAGLLLAPTAAALTVDVPNPMRAVLLQGFVGVAAGCGAARLGGWLRQRPWGWVVVGVVAISSAQQVLQYRREHPREAAGFYLPNRTLVEAGRECVEAGEVAWCHGEFVEAYARLYAPECRRRRRGGGWVLGEGEVTVELWLEGGEVRRRERGRAGGPRRSRGSLVGRGD